MSKKSSPGIAANRSSVTGKFVTEKFAKNHPKTTEKEHYKANSKSSGRKK